MIARAVLIVIGVSASVSSAFAGVVWSEDWNPSNFAIGGMVSDGAVGNVTDRSGWLNASYNVFSSAGPADQHGWTFSGSDFLIINTTAGSPSEGAGALYLNECCNPGVTGGGGAVASTTITGLTAGRTYDVSFTYWGDNRPNGSYPGYYDLLVSLDGGTPVAYPGVDQSPGTGGGALVDVPFTATGSTESLALAQFSSGDSQQSPIIGAITVSASAPEVPTWAMMALGFAGLGYAGFRRTRKDRTPRSAF